MGMTDLELLEKYVNECRDFVNPKLFREIDKRGLMRFVNYLPHDKLKANAVLKARLAKEGKVFGNEEIDQISSEIKRLEFLRKELANQNIADVDKTLPIINEMKTISEFLFNYYN